MQKTLKEKELDIELSLVLARIYKFLKLKKGFSLDILDKKISKNDMLFFPRLTLLAAQGSKGITKKTRTLAVLIQIIYLSTEIHSQIQENVKENTKFEKEIQLPILVGDFLYSRFYDILCAEDCLEFLDDFIYYISELNIAWIKYLEGQIQLEDICNLWYGELGYIAANLASSLSGLNNNWQQLVKDYGKALGYVYGTKKLSLSATEQDRARNELQKTLSRMPNGNIKEVFNYNAYKSCDILYTNPGKIKFKHLAVAEN